MTDIPTVDLGPEDEAPPPSEDRLNRIIRLARLQVQQERVVAQAEEDLERAKAALRTTQESDLPMALTEAGLTVSGITLDEYFDGNHYHPAGERVELVQEMHAYISKDKEKQAYAWFDEDGHGDLLKHTITVKLPRGFPETVQRIKRSLAKFNDTLPDAERFEMTDKLMMYWQTLQKFVRDADKAGREDLPEDLLGIFRRRVTVVTQPDEAKL